MWLPRRVEIFIETIESHLGAIREGSKKQEDAIHNASISASKDRREIPRIIASAIETAAQDVPAYEKIQRDKEYRQQSRLILVAYLSLASAMVVGVVAYLQWKQMVRATQATEEAAYAACRSAQIARSTLIAMQASSADTHNVAGASLVQAEAANREESPHLRIERQSPMSSGPVLTFPLPLNNIGRTEAKHIRAKFIGRIMKSGEEPSRFTFPEKTSDHFEAGYMAPQDTPAPLIVNVKNPDGSVIDLSKDPSLNQKIVAGEMYIIAYGQIRFDDADGVAHWLHFCIRFEAKDLNPYKHEKCAAYNQTDNGAVYSVAKSTQFPAPVPEEIVCPTPK